MTVTFEVSYIVEEEIHQCHSSGTRNNLIAIEGFHFQELLLFLLDFQPEQNALTQYCSQQTEQIKRVHQQLTDHLDQRFTIEALSKQYLMNTATLKKVFKAVYGLPIATYMKEYRIRQAMKLLRETDAPIAEIASQVGYGTQGKFSEAFKDVAQMLPTAYRKAHVSSDRASEARP